MISFQKYDRVTDELILNKKCPKIIPGNVQDLIEKIHFNLFFVSVYYLIC